MRESKPFSHIEEVFQCSGISITFFFAMFRFCTVLRETLLMTTNALMFVKPFFFFFKVAMHISIAISIPLWLYF